MEHLIAANVRQNKTKSCFAPDICRRGQIVKQRWEVLEKLGAGTFGQVYKVLDLKTGMFWALKVESNKARKPVLRMDVVIARALNGKIHAAKFFACGHEAEFSYMVTQLLGRNLASRKRTSQDGRFPLRTVIRIGIQGIDAIRDLHESGYLHRDIKPSNFATGVGENERLIYLIDFGLARKFLDEKGHIYPPRAKANFRGTVRYASPRAHLQKEQSRGDDIWSLLYSMIDLHVGRLPWHNVRDMKRVGEAKMLISPDELFRKLPATWCHIYALCKDLAYESVPDYNYVIRLMNGVTPTRPTGIIDMKRLTTAQWEWDAPAESPKAASEQTSGSV